MPYHRSEEHTSELQSHDNLVCRLLLEKKKQKTRSVIMTHSNAPNERSRAPALAALPCPLRAVCASSLVAAPGICFLFFFFFNDTATTEIYTLSLHDVFRS